MLDPTRETQLGDSQLHPHQVKLCPMILLGSLGPQRDNHFGTKKMMENLAMEDYQPGLQDLLSGVTKLNVMKLRKLR